MDITNLKDKKTTREPFWSSDIFMIWKRCIISGKRVMENVRL